uniref:transposase n=1 Tax=Prosthecobacter sp. TaxID=1965333 RepID=UPI0037831ED4
EAIFHDDADRRFFLHTLSQACEMTGWRVHAWVLMGNHYHLFLQTPEPNLVAGMSWLQNTLTRRYNVRHSKWGRLFGDRYKAVIVEGTDPYHYQTLLDYIHLNPVRAKLIRPASGKSVLDYRWSSLAGGYALPPKERPKWLAAASGLRAFNLEDNAAGRRQMIKRLDRRALTEELATCGVPPLPEEADARSSHLRRGWFWGTQAFGDAMRKLADAAITNRAPKSRSYRSNPHVTSHSQQQAEAWLRQGLKAASLKPAEVTRLTGSDPRKLLLADLLWRHHRHPGMARRKLAMKIRRQRQPAAPPPRPQKSPRPSPQGTPPLPRSRRIPRPMTALRFVNYLQTDPIHPAKKTSP